MSEVSKSRLGISEAAVLADLVVWAKDCPKWQQDALRRICLHGGLDKNDIDELTALCKGRGATIPIDLTHVNDRSSSEASISLKSIHSVQNVNALAPSERLTFEKIGVTILYGDNGSGKSGYARILKRACRARVPRGESLLPNVYKSASGSPTATIEYMINDRESRRSVWTLERPAEATLSAISVFDSRAANVHVDDANDVAYTPFSLGLLSLLAKTCVEIKGRLNAEVAALQSQTPTFILKPPCNPETRTSKLLSALGRAKEADVLALSTMSANDIARLNTLKTDLASDPAKLSRQLQAQKASLDQLLFWLHRVTAACSDASCLALESAWKNFIAARAAANAVSTTLFSREALPEIGTESWLLLWEAARTYSTTGAYREKPFPVTEDGARCVLCLQELSADAAERLNRFEQFVKDESKRREADAKTAYEQMLAPVLESIATESNSLTLVALLANDLGDAELAGQSETMLAQVFVRLKEIRDQHGEEGIEPRPLPELPTAKLREVAAGLEARALALFAEGNSESRKQALAELAELSDRQWLGTVLEDVIAESGRQKEMARLERCAKDTNTKRITDKSTAVVETLLTANLQSKFLKEVSDLGVHGLAIELKKEKASVGVPRFRVSLANKHEGASGKVGEVLSEGEFRCIALAAFLAEATTTGGTSAIVFDDPMSSLDHMHREAVARRIARLGKDRQVVVFTHDLAFLFLLHEECRGAKAHIGFRSISKGSEYSGFCSVDPPANAQPVTRAIESMRKDLANRRVQFERGMRAEWSQSAYSFFKELRTTWERAVADALASVVSRLSNKVDTKNLIKLTVLTEDDYKVMRDAYGRCSKLMHSQASELNRPTPRPDEIEREIDILSEWVVDIQRRQEALKIPEALSTTVE